MAVTTLFKHRKAHVRIVGPSGKVYTFRNHQYFSLLEAEIAELTKIAKDRSSGIFIDPNQSTIDSEASDPVSVMKKNLRAQILAELAEENAKGPAASTSDQSIGLTKIASTADSVINGNSAAEEEERRRLAAKAAEQGNNIVKEDSTLDILNKLKQASQATASQQK